MVDESTNEKGNLKWCFLVSLVSLGSDLGWRGRFDLVGIAQTRSHLLFMYYVQSFCKLYTKRRVFYRLCSKAKSSAPAQQSNKADSLAASKVFASYAAYAKSSASYAEPSANYTMSAASRTKSSASNAEGSA